MLKKTLIATAAISATLLAAATMLPALAQSRSAASASATSASTATSAPAPGDAGLPDKRSAADDSGARASTSQSERGQERRKAKESERDDHLGDAGRGGSIGKDTENEEHRAWRVFKSPSRSGAGR